MTAQTDAAIAARALPLLDLTDLGDSCTDATIAALCENAQAGPVAAVCVWPAFVPACRRRLGTSAVRIATVVNFPAGGEDVEATVAETRATLLEGAQEIDLVLPYRALLRGDEAAARAMVEAVRAVCGPACLKVILETGTLAEPGTIAAASRLALEAGADFIKTSTGKSPVSATPEAAATMLAAIRESGRPAGLKVSGGLRSVADAATYLALADRLMGPGWVSPATMRLGASSLYGALTAAKAAA
ncbi:deoxyribose-phosphate aldolase [Methylobacterium gregans]|uniref:Deoxyribose-phosphate aldolase n=1 Tax=Methylobacterium gregans TaxID=374424 RepID=A0AA37MCR2_9HYPH|nr:deoxyribose-phosphate aldolase [Methylobacterium gregans]MDQ0522649.1 deoxyribose-phosphate aldolase [Methylobacterium gregans]GJD81332.1 Deoxyribose-phosphate aldolase [Methylobacterium gregans]GLS56827.1 deoxyribose-phosphate aldolase [Methylobacterium gregans]